MRDEISSLIISRVLPTQQSKKALKKLAVLDVHTRFLQSKASVSRDLLQNLHHDLTGNSELVVLKTLPVDSLNIVVGNHDFMHPLMGFSVR